MTVSPPFYELIDWDTAPLGASSIFLIEYAGSGCWNLFLDYSTLKKTYCQLPGSGVPSATSETQSIDGSPVGMPATLYGYSNPNTNNALRIKGASGFVPWATALSSGETAYYDERYGQPGCSQSGYPYCAYYWFGWYNPNYYVYAVNT